MGVPAHFHILCSNWVFADVSILITGFGWLFLLINWAKRKILKVIKIIYIMEYENEIDINGLKFRVNPVYNQYAASECGKLININNEAIMLGCPAKCGLSCRVRAINDKKYKSMTLQRFVCECYNGIVPNDMKIVHIDDNSLNNRLSNLYNI